MQLLVILVMGAALGWLAAMIVQQLSMAAILRNIAIGVAGTLVGAVIAGAILDGGNGISGTLHIEGWLLAFAIGAVLLAAANWNARETV